MEKITLSKLFNGKLFSVPDYQRGYAWEQKQLLDFTQDIDALIDEEIRSHYTGTIVLFQPKDKRTEYFGTDKLEIFEIVDGQQRLTTCQLYLSIILRQLVAQAEQEYEKNISSLVHSGNKPKLRLNNDSKDFFLDLLKNGSSSITPINIHQKRLEYAFNTLNKHISEQLTVRQEKIGYLKELYDALTRKLHFSHYIIDDESEIGMTFELMNSRGKGLSVLELLKNYLMHWVYRNVPGEPKRETITDSINRAWKDVYLNIASANGNEDQCLRIAWTLLQSPTPKNWKGYVGFKAPSAIPLRDFSKKSKQDTYLFIEKLASELKEFSYHYSRITNPQLDPNIPGEYERLVRIKNTGNTSIFLPLITASRQKVINGHCDIAHYLNLLETIELYSYRVFLWARRRSNAGQAKLFHLGYNIYQGNLDLNEAQKEIKTRIMFYSEEDNFKTELTTTFTNWYRQRKLLKYTLYEYEIELLNKKGKGAQPKLSWKDLSDSTLEHILPQTPELDSLWLQKWSEEDIKHYLHHISNIVLTRDNSHYRNFEFDRKKGSQGKGHCYANSDIRQEREISKYGDWTIAECKHRKVELEQWILGRWGLDESLYTAEPDEKDEDELEEELLW
ncbi:DUF262 domain-containing protein [Phaeocystidibacter luteus]|uniref:DUF262 domain-containing protein n=1 Tax=Phaeocystidibacter luteus TaxID=911197 RepID=A0A6N6RHT2_9FLAO|nr:DUF262 domain-containing protein [Phaeocystidibacter luteus]KAB2810010.1 DUF262 domain-containing protein [Phaeocystidibacter luteus]